MPANEPYRRFDENGNWQPPPNRAGFYKQNPQYANARLQNPKGHPDGPYTKAGLALDKWEKEQKAKGLGPYNKWTYDPVTQTKLQTGKYRKGDNPYKGITAQERVAAGERPHRVSYAPGADKPTITYTGESPAAADRSRSDFMARGQSPAAAVEDGYINQYDNDDRRSGFRRMAGDIFNTDSQPVHQQNNDVLDLSGFDIMQGFYDRYR